MSALACGDAAIKWQHDRLRRAHAVHQMRDAPVLRRTDRGRARDPRTVKSPLELELWRVRSRCLILSCELRCDANGWDVLIRLNGEALFPRRCTSEDEARYVANGMKQDELNTGGIEVSSHQ
jgi:hypothetical protein